jgi:hypothetical protein
VLLTELWNANPLLRQYLGSTDTTLAYNEVPVFDLTGLVFVSN